MARWRLYAARDWLLRFGTLTALWLVIFVVTILIGLLCAWLAYLGDLTTLIGTTQAIFAALVPALIIFIVMVWQGRIWRRDWLWNRWTIKVD